MHVLSYIYIAFTRRSDVTVNHSIKNLGITALLQYIYTIHVNAIEPGVPPSETWSTQLLVLAKPAPGECRRKYK